MPSRIVIIGTSSSGKSTLARKIAAEKGIPHIELDVLFWQPGWVETPQAEFHEKIRKAVAATEGWVLCGNYNVAKQISMPLATDIIWLNYPLYINMWRGFKRSIQRISSGEDAFDGCRETFQLTFMSKKSILLWIWNTHAGRRVEFAKLLTKENFPKANIWVVENEGDYGRVLRGI